MSPDVCRQTSVNLLTRRSSTSTANAHTNAAANASPGWDEARWKELMSQPGHRRPQRRPGGNAEKTGGHRSQTRHVIGPGGGQSEIARRSAAGRVERLGQHGPGRCIQLGAQPVKSKRTERGYFDGFSQCRRHRSRWSGAGGQIIMQQDPSGDGGYGSSLVDALCDAGNLKSRQNLPLMATTASAHFGWGKPIRNGRNSSRNRPPPPSPPSPTRTCEIKLCMGSWAAGRKRTRRDWPNF